MKKLGCLAKTIEDEIIRDGLCSVGALEDLPKSKKLVAVVGGMGVQSYIHSSYRRPTSDIDLLVGKPLNSQEFKEFSKPSVEYLRDNGYNVEYTKASGAYKLLVSNPKSEEIIVIEFARRNPHNFEKHKTHIERELDNSRKKMIESRFASFSVVSPEDLVLPKIARSINTSNRRPDLFNRISSYELPFAEEFIQERLKIIKEIRKDAMLHLGDPLIAEELRLVSDLYDVRILSESVGYNEHYLNRASNDWGALKEDSPFKRQILGILPKIKTLF